MIILDENGNELKESELDLVNGYLTLPTYAIKPDAIPVDNVTKFAWSDDDYEEVQYYYVTSTEKRTEQRIDELKAKLSETDYVVIKIAEGVATAEEYAAVIADREAWRKEINELEGSDG